MSTSRVNKSLAKQQEQKVNSISSIWQRFTTWGYQIGIGLYNQTSWAPVWLPITWANLTGCAFPHTERLKGHFLFGRYQIQDKDGLGFSTEIMKAAKLAEQDPKGRCYFSVGLFSSVNWIFVVTKTSDWDQLFIHNKHKLGRGIAPITDFVFGEKNILGFT